MYILLLPCCARIKIWGWRVFAYAWEHSQLGLCVHCVGNSIYANASACAESVSEGCHLFDTLLLLRLRLQNRRTGKQMDWLWTIFHLHWSNQLGKAAITRKLNMITLICLVPVLRDMQLLSTAGRRRARILLWDGSKNLCNWIKYFFFPALTLGYEI